MSHKIPCPRCNTPQNFFERDRVVGSKVEIYIKCSVCRLEKVLETIDEDKYEQYKQINDLRTKAMSDPHLIKTLNYKIRRK
jgi:hypothetical protein